MAASTARIDLRASSIVSSSVSLGARVHRMCFPCMCVRVYVCFVLHSLQNLGARFSLSCARGRRTVERAGSIFIVTRGRRVKKCQGTPTATKTKTHEDGAPSVRRPLRSQRSLLLRSFACLTLSRGNFPSATE